VSLLGLAIVGLGVILAVLGAWRAWVPYARVRALDADEANLKRYEAWRGSRRTSTAQVPTSADLLRDGLMRQARWWTAVAALGVILIVVGVLIRA
jgi:hypothetical protein